MIAANRLKFWQTSPSQTSQSKPYDAEADANSLIALWDRLFERALAHADEVGNLDSLTTLTDSLATMIAKSNRFAEAVIAAQNS